MKLSNNKITSSDLSSDLFASADAPVSKSSAYKIAENNKNQPLADRLRPTALNQIIGQNHLLGEEGILYRMIEHQKLASIILWGGPGTGKTTIARILAQSVELHFIQISAVFSGVSDLKRVFDEARRYQQTTGKGTLLFVDEIHRFNRAQQDGFLPVVEDGTIVLVGATTENPSFSLNAALLSRCQVLVLHRLDDQALEKLLVCAEEKLSHNLPLTSEARQDLRAMANGDGRYLLNMVEQLLPGIKGPILDRADLSKIVSRRAVLYDKDREEHYNLISALHKSLRGSDVDAALYWFSRMIEGGEDPHYIVRRLTRFATEDIGIADPNALTQAITAWNTYERLGSPEGELALAQLVVYLAVAPKSNSVYKAFSLARQAAKKTGSLSPPQHILNAPTNLMKELGYGKGYEYDHDMPDAFSGQNYFPDQMHREQFYFPTSRGKEQIITQRLEEWAQLRKKRSL